WEEEMQRYETEKEEYERAKKEARKPRRKGRAAVLEFPSGAKKDISPPSPDSFDSPDEPPGGKPQQPILRRLTVNDATAEALVPILQENPRGVLLIRDELIGWVSSMNQYREGGKGADQQFWLSAWSGATVTVDRKKTHDLGPLRVRHPFVNVVGGLTPDKLPALRGDTPKKKAEQDGFIDRVLMSYPKPAPIAAENWLEIAPETLARHREVMDRLASLQMVPVQEGGRIKG